MAASCRERAWSRHSIRAPRASPSPRSLARRSLTTDLRLGSLIQIPVAAAEVFYSTLGGVSSGSGDGTYIIPCNVPIGSIAFVFNGVHYEIPPTDLLRAISRDGSQCLLTIAGVDNRDARGNEVAIVSRLSSAFLGVRKLTRLPTTTDRRRFPQERLLDLLLLVQRRPRHRVGQEYHRGQLGRLQWHERRGRWGGLLGTGGDGQCEPGEYWTTDYDGGRDCQWGRVERRVIVSPLWSLLV